MLLNKAVPRDRLVRVAATTDDCADLRHGDGSADECQSRVTVNVDVPRRWP